ncbi:hypothetical protein AOLI_G00282090 [Acnodon oligacanthus]
MDEEVRLSEVSDAGGGQFSSEMLYSVDQINSFLDETKGRPLAGSTVDCQSLALLRKDDGSVTSDPIEMRRLAVHFYSDLFTAGGADQCCSEVLLADLPKLDQEQSQVLDTTPTFEEVIEAVHQLTSGRAPGVDSLPVDFYKAFCGIIGKDLLSVL